MPLLLCVPGSLKDRKELQDRLRRHQPGRDQTEQRRGGYDSDPPTAAAAAAGESALIHGGPRGFIPESASGTARADQHDPDGRGANRVHKQHDRLQFTVREDLVVSPRGLKVPGQGLDFFVKRNKGTRLLSTVLISVREALGTLRTQGSKDAPFERRDAKINLYIIRARGRFECFI